MTIKLDKKIKVGQIYKLDRAWGMYSSIQEFKEQYVEICRGEIFLILYIKELELKESFNPSTHIEVLYNGKKLIRRYIDTNAVNRLIEIKT